MFRSVNVRGGVGPVSGVERAAVCARVWGGRVELGGTSVLELGVRLGSLECGLDGADIMESAGM